MLYLKWRDVQIELMEIKYDEVYRNNQEEIRVNFKKYSGLED